VLIQKRKGIMLKQFLDKVVQNKDGEYAVIDRISQDVPFSCVSKKCRFNNNKL
jgi:hypothetical protein